MKSKTLFLCAVVLACAALMLVSCSTVGIRRRSRVRIGRGNGPPPHAPAHGHRHKHAANGLDLVYDSGCGVYVVVDLPNHYYHEGHFFRIRGAQWEVSLQVSGKKGPGLRQVTRRNKRFFPGVELPYRQVSFFAHAAAVGSEFETQTQNQRIYALIRRSCLAVRDML
jgi:hypothetical protein